MSALQDAKLWAVAWSGLPKDALHIYVGLAVFLAASLAMRWRLASWRAWLVVAAVALAGEAWDVADTIRVGVPLRPSANWHDLWNTTLWPAVLTLAAKTGRLRP